MSQNNWLPQGYKVPKPPSDYMDLEDGANKLRIMSSVVMGYMYFTHDKKVVHLHEEPREVPSDIGLDKAGKQNKVKHFWAFIMWNYSQKRIQQLKITQSTIQSAIQDLVVNEDWGAPTEYDITITKKGKDLLTEYSVQPSPHKPTTEEQRIAFRNTKIDLDSLFSDEKQDTNIDDVPPFTEEEVSI